MRDGSVPSHSPDADTIVILSSELIAKITEQYFNRVMFKPKVAVVDLQPTATGYAFSIAFVDAAKPPPGSEGVRPTMRDPLAGVALPLTLFAADAGETPLQAASGGAQAVQQAGRDRHGKGAGAKPEES